MKKTLFLVSLLLMIFSLTNAAGNKVSKKIMSENLLNKEFCKKVIQIDKTKDVFLSDIKNIKILSPKYAKSARFTYYDECGQKLSFTVSCNGCSGTDLGNAADNYANSRTGADGCFY
ncbi:MAG: hypothetical protein ABJB05_05465 [Parafilimonas sp.]